MLCSTSLLRGIKCGVLIPQNLKYQQRPLENSSKDGIEISKENIDKALSHRKTNSLRLLLKEYQQNITKNFTKKYYSKIFQSLLS